MPTDESGTPARMERGGVQSGVGISQGYVLRPILWIIGYDAVLRVPGHRHDVLHWLHVGPGWGTLVARDTAHGPLPSLAWCVL